MSAAKGKLFRLGAATGLGYGVATYLMCLIKGWGPDADFYIWLTTLHVGLSLLGLLFRNPAQVDWYRRSIFMPWAAPYGVGFLLIALGAEDAAYIVVIAAPLLVVAVPIVWLAGALAISQDPEPRRL